VPDNDTHLHWLMQLILQEGSQNSVYSSLSALFLLNLTLGFYSILIHAHDAYRFETRVELVSPIFARPRTST
jgi:hypothetical protein